jgi:hypothetical protein
MFAPGSSGLLLSQILILGAVVAYAQPYPAEPAAEERAPVAQRFATDRLSYWQQKLNLQDWHIAVLLSPADQLRHDTVGNVHWDLDQKTATIRILDPADYHQPWQPMLLDMEFTIVHELIHLQLAPVLAGFPRNDTSRRDEEFAVNHMTEALLAFERTAAAAAALPH